MVSILPDGGGLVEESWAKMVSGKFSLRYIYKFELDHRSAHVQNHFALSTWPNRSVSQLWFDNFDTVEIMDHGACSLSSTLSRAPCAVLPKEQTCHSNELGESRLGNLVKFWKLKLSEPNMKIPLKFGKKKLHVFQDQRVFLINLHFKNH